MSPAEPAGKNGIAIHRSMVIMTMDLPRNASLEDKQVQPLTYESQTFCVLSLGGRRSSKKTGKVEYVCCSMYGLTCVAK